MGSKNTGYGLNNHARRFSILGEEFNQSLMRPCTSHLNITMDRKYVSSLSKIRVSKSINQQQVSRPLSSENITGILSLTIFKFFKPLIKCFIDEKILVGSGL